MGEDIVTGLTFYTNPQSRGRIARWMLEEVGAPYDTVVLDYAGAMKTADYLGVNPMGKVPAIRHGDRVVTEGAAICAYLADAFPDVGLAPPPADRADYYRWLFFAAGPLEAAVLDKAMGLTPNEKQRQMAGYGHLDLAASVLDRAVAARDWIAGDRFTAADVYVGASIGWYTQFGLIERTPAFAAYLDRLHARPAYIRAAELDDAAAAT
ncbi:glutathione S-transferase family protein [Sphingomonas sp. CFBP 8760]|uniref:glutathione S-transferase family protein n=1 Tax=Sphingomonas sp. CFBP 8760 TaxID=2775282 RepID=UPI00177E41C1|nr:glutathione S-transferase family protein [Sphingomonas sp. CFBP 8760]MBD8545481.1 glutathione S-transferase family protein [Sphingomonas sp. CFBP 8760]